MNYRIVQGDQLSNHPLGSARSFGPQAAYAISRAQGHQLNWKASFEHKGFSNQNATGLVSDYANIVLNQQLSGFSVDGEGGMNVYHLSFTSGRVGLSGSPNQQDDAATAKTEGGFVKWNYGFTRQQLLSQQWTLSLAYAGQWSRRNLDSSEKFYIGGPSSVRAYPASEGGGARGYQFNLDLRYAVDNQKSVSVFYDYGRVRVAAQPWDNHINDLALHGRGVSAQWDLTPKTRLKATMAWRTGANPNPTASGTDQDGTRKEPRFWFEATQNF
jgi:hemolysin activation/secretion protein